MIVEHFRNDDAVPVYRRFAERGRLAPAGLKYISSWVDVNLARCFQLMETNERGQIDEWISHWSDLVEFEVFPVISSREAAAIVDAKASGDSEAYKRWLQQISQHVAEAANEGGFLGAGGVPIPGNVLPPGSVAGGVQSAGGSGERNTTAESVTAIGAEATSASRHTMSPFAGSRATTARPSASCTPTTATPAATNGPGGTAAISRSHTGCPVVTSTATRCGALGTPVASATCSAR